jgi:hypothetical protein
MKKTGTLSKIIFSFLLLCFLSINSKDAFAAFFVGTGDNLTGVEDILVNGEYYDVTFVDGVVEQVYSTYEHIFFGDTQQAADANNALKDILTGTVYAAYPSFLYGIVDADNIKIHTITGYFENFYADDDMIKTTTLEINGLDSSALPGTMYLESSNMHGSSSTGPYELGAYDNNVIAIWTAADVSEVPVPTTIVLLSSALLGLAGIKRRRNKSL